MTRNVSKQQLESPLYLGVTGHDGLPSIGNLDACYQLIYHMGNREKQNKNPTTLFNPRRRRSNLSTNLCSLFNCSSSMFVLHFSNKRVPNSKKMSASILISISTLIITNSINPSSRHPCSVSLYPTPVIMRWPIPKIMCAQLLLQKTIRFRNNVTEIISRSSNKFEFYTTTSFSPQPIANPIRN